MLLVPLFVLQELKGPDTVTVAEQSHVMADGVDDQVGEVLLFVPPPGVTASGLILQSTNNATRQQRLC